MLKRLLPICFMAGLLLAGCKGRDNRTPPGSEEVFAIRDSIRSELFLRLGRAQQEINRQLEALRNRAYDADRKTARRLNHNISAIENDREALKHQREILQQDTLLHDWSLLEQETELLLNRAGHRLGVSF